MLSCPGNMPLFRERKPCHCFHSYRDVSDRGNNKEYNHLDHSLQSSHHLSTSLERTTMTYFKPCHVMTGNSNQNVSLVNIVVLLLINLDNCREVGFKMY